MRYFFLLSLLLQQFSALAQIDTLQSKSSVESYLKRRYHYKAITLNTINLVIQDTNTVQPTHPAYWLKADFNHDGKSDLFASATVEKGKLDNQSELFILSSEGNHYTKVDIVDPVSYVYSGDASYSIYSASGMSYLVITTLVQKMLRPQDIRHGHYFTYISARDTVFVRNNKQIIYANHPTQLAIESVKFSATQCFGTCPVFQLTINKDGSVSYKGIQYVNKIGDYNLAMPKAELYYLISLLDAINPPRLSDHYSVDVTDNPTIYLAIRYTNGQTKSIEDYGERGTYGLAVLHKFLLDLRNF
ncbi:DUF6438 domain-containing protein [Hymenobacter cheonanensis]|uniref:DUF6438 domain-containing protein n=1 Tax=Hymenobacter sp. CA2-7 TaxID=3063993 RepID=UPI002713D88C|nr:DUF6438 domain-containing protein [Hymenobacter sp. CA2-7]MDO7883770.1 DUF6438 domain-containing protein [Hymenobacter sp. CA2-7]